MCLEKYWRISNELEIFSQRSWEIINDSLYFRQFYSPDDCLFADPSASIPELAPYLSISRPGPTINSIRNQKHNWMKKNLTSMQNWIPNMLQHVTRWPNACNMQCYDMLRWNVAIVWPELNITKANQALWLVNSACALLTHCDSYASFVLSNLPRASNERTDVSFSCVCLVIDHEFRHNIVKVAVDFQIVCSRSLTHRTNIFMRLSAYWWWKLANEHARISAVIEKNPIVYAKCLPFVKSRDMGDIC